MWMKTIHSRITTQGQISVPAEVRRTLGVGPGAVLEWESHPEGFVVKRAGRVSTLDIHRLLFGPRRSGRQTVIDSKAAVTRYIRERHARR